MAGFKSFSLLFLVLLFHYSFGSNETANPLLQLQFNAYVQSVQLSGTNCVRKVALRHFPEKSSLAMVKTRKNYASIFSTGISTEDMVLTDLLSTNYWPLVMKYVGIEKIEFDFGFEKVDNYLIFYQSAEELEEALQELSKQASWNSHGQFIGYLIFAGTDFGIGLDESVNVFWKYFILNVVIISSEPTVKGQLFFTYFPYKDGSCGTGQYLYEVIGTCVQGEIGPADMNAFPKKVPDDFNQCPVKIAALNSPPFVMEAAYSSHYLDKGIEMSILETLAKVANFKPEVKISFLPTTDNASVDGLWKELNGRTVDLAVGTLSPTIETHRSYDFSVQYTEDRSAWIVPADTIVANWLRLLLVFEPAVFGTTFAILLFFWFSWTRIVKYVTINFKKERIMYKSQGTIFLTIIGMLLANVPSAMPRTRFLKSLLIMWSLFCFYWCSAFNATLMSVLTNSMPSDQIETEDQIMERKLKLWAGNQTLTYLERTENNASFYALDVCPVLEECLSNISTGRNSVLATSRNYFDYVKRKFTDVDGKYRLKALKSNIVTVPIEMLLPRGSPLLSRINGILLNIIESGLIGFWEESIKSRQTVQDEKLNIRSETILTLDNLQGAFFLWGFGITLSIVAFVWEVVKHHK